MRRPGASTASVTKRTCFAQASAPTRTALTCSDSLGSRNRMISFSRASSWRLSTQSSNRPGKRFDSTRAKCPRACISTEVWGRSLMPKLERHGSKHLVIRHGETA